MNEDRPVQPGFRPLDYVVRKRLERDLRTNFLVEAGAGSGKTSQLVKRMLALICEGEAAVTNIAAITFTRKAAAQLRERCQVRLEEEYRKAIPGVHFDRLGDALRDLDRCFIGTVHAFCSHLIRERALEAGLDPGFTEVEGVEETLLEQASWSEYLDQVRLFGDGRLAALMRLGVNPTDLQALYSRLAAAPDVTAVCTDVPAPDLEPARAAVSAFLTQAAARLPQAPPPGGWDPLQKVLRQAIGLARVLDLQEARSLVRVLMVLDKASAKPTLNRWPTATEAREVEATFLGFRLEWAVPTLQVWREYLYPILIRFALPGVGLYAQRRRERSLLNFQDLLMTATALLRDHPHVRRYFARRYTHLLVDEFQDTDPIQAELMLLLTGEPSTETDWRQVSPRPGALFVVGDPRQSIYRFRRADITVYQQFKERLVTAGGEVLHLTANFRSVQAIGTWVDPIFQHLLPVAANPYQAAYGPMHTTLANPAQAVFHGIYQIKVPRMNRHAHALIANHDAARVAWACAGNVQLARTPDEVAEGIDPAARPGDFLILATRRDWLACYARALETYGVPFTVTGGRGFGEGEEITELLTLLQAVADPEDTVALVGALRGRYTGLPDDLLYRFRKAGGWFHYVRPQTDLVGCEVVLEALERIRRYGQLARQLPPAAAIEAIVADLGIIPFALSGEMGGSRAGNLLKAVELLRATQAADLAEAIAQFETILETGDVAEGQVGAESVNAVRLMNLHRAKGLEAHVVFLVDPSESPDHAPTAHVRRSEEGSVGYYLAQRQRGYQVERIAQPVGWAQWEAEDAKYDAAERLRLLYVAATRARSAVVVSRYPDKEEGPWAPLSQWVQGVPELPVVEVTPVVREVAKVDALELAEALEAVEEARSSAAQSAYTSERVTDRVHAGEKPPWQETEHGQSWGTAVHECLEGLAREPERQDLLDLSRRALVSAGRDEAEAEGLVGVIHLWMATPLWVRAAASAERYAEVPVSAMDGPAMVSGTVDLVFREAGGWVIVDYKTDTFAPGDLEAFVRFYGPQLQEYARLWREAVGEPVSEAYLYFAGLGVDVRINVDWSQVHPDLRP